MEEIERGWERAFPVYFLPAYFLCVFIPFYRWLDSALPTAFLGGFLAMVLQPSYSGELFTRSGVITLGNHFFYIQKPAVFEYKKSEIGE
jgi:hypothetical protein